MYGQGLSPEQKSSANSLGGNLEQAYLIWSEKTRSRSIRLCHHTARGHHQAFKAPDREKSCFYYVQKRSVLICHVFPSGTSF